MLTKTDSSESLSVVVLLEHEVRDGRKLSSERPNIVSSRLQFAAIDASGAATDAGIAPHLNLRAASREEIAMVEDLLAEEWLSKDMEKAATSFATVELARQHVTTVKKQRLPKIEKIEREVNLRLSKEINYWDARAFELKEQERFGKKTRLNWENAEHRAAELAERKKRRLDLLEQEKHISSLPPRVTCGMVVVPRGILDARKNVPPDHAADPVARREIEVAAMDSVMAAEKRLGRIPEDVSAKKIGYDVESYDPREKGFRFIEVKGRAKGAKTVSVTRQEIITSLHEPDKFILAIVEVCDGLASEPQYIKGALDEREPPFDHTSIQVQNESVDGTCSQPFIANPFIRGHFCSWMQAVPMQSRKKKLIEVAIPLEAINAASAREKSIRHGHPSTLHLWWSRKPLATCRAVLFAQLVDDPSGYPEQFPTEGEVDKERQRLFGIIEKLIVWENSTNEPVLEQARTEIRRSCGGTLPFVYDPFSGGGSIPLEAQRLGLPACGSDLNPIAVMIGKAMIEIPPRFKDIDSSPSWHEEPESLSKCRRTGRGCEALWRMDSPTSMGAHWPVLSNGGFAEFARWGQGDSNRLDLGANCAKSRSRIWQYPCTSYRKFSAFFQGRARSSNRAKGRQNLQIDPLPDS